MTGFVRARETARLMAIVTRLETEMGYLTGRHLGRVTEMWMGSVMVRSSLRVIDLD